MNLLTIDSATSALTIGIHRQGQLLGEYTTQLKQNHSTRLMPSIQFLLQEAQQQPQDLTHIAVGVGPGSYTGVRIGVTTAKSLAWSLSIPLIGVSTLQTMAASVGTWNGWIIPFIDARRGQVYTALYHFNEDQIEAVEADRIENMSDWLEYVEQKTHNEPIAFIGEGMQQHEAALALFKGKRGSLVHIVSPSNGWIKASAMARLVEMLKLEGSIERAYDLVPNYTQLAEAEAKWLSGRK
jgi:tRNA threonylcarbamoyladenosine biosynthesis protein TsaB